MYTFSITQIIDCKLPQKTPQAAHEIHFPRCAIFKILLRNRYPESHELENKLYKQTNQYAEMQADIV